MEAIVIQLRLFYRLPERPDKLRIWSQKQHNKHVNLKYTTKLNKSAITVSNEINPCKHNCIYIHVNYGVITFNLWIHNEASIVFQTRCNSYMYVTNVCTLIEADITHVGVISLYIENILRAVTVVARRGKLILEPAILMPGMTF